MRKSKYTLAIILSVFIFATSCKKEEKDPTPTTTTPATACNGMTLCFKLDGIEESHNATLKVLADRYRVYWEEGTGNSYKNIEIDIYATAAGTFPIASSPAAGQSGFQYYITNGGKNIQGESGNIEITSFATDKITGKFTVTAKDGSGTTYQITEGNFVNVIK